MVTILPHVASADSGGPKIQKSEGNCTAEYAEYAELFTEGREGNEEEAQSVLDLWIGGWVDGWIGGFLNREIGERREKGR